MSFKSKAQIAKFGELVKQGKMQKSTMDEWMRATKDAHKLPERLSKGDSVSKAAPKKDDKKPAGKAAPKFTSLDAVKDFRKKKFGV